MLTFVRDLKDPAALTAALADLPGVRIFDQVKFLNETYARFRIQTLQAIRIGHALIVLILFIRYRRWRPVLAALVPAVLAGAATLGLLGVLGVEANLLHVLSLLMVLSMGVDYTVFLVECGRERNLGPTTMSLWGAAVTTMLSFGLLALSTPRRCAPSAYRRRRHRPQLPARPADADNHARRVGAEGTRPPAAPRPR